MKFYVWQNRMGKIFACAMAVSLADAVQCVKNAGHPDFYFVNNGIMDEDEVIWPIEYTQPAGASGLCARRLPN